MRPRDFIFLVIIFYLLVKLHNSPAVTVDTDLPLNDHETLMAQTEVEEYLEDQADQAEISKRLRLEQTQKEIYEEGKRQRLEEVETERLARNKRLKESHVGHH